MTTAATVVMVNHRVRTFAADRCFGSPGFYAVLSPERKLRGVYVWGDPLTLPEDIAVGDTIVRIPVDD